MAYGESAAARLQFNHADLGLKALYFICRICMVMHIFAIAVNLNAIAEIPCMSVTWISKSALNTLVLTRAIPLIDDTVSDAIGTCGASLILALRTIAVWHQDKKVAGGLGLLFLGQIALWVQSALSIFYFWQHGD